MNDINLWLMPLPQVMCKVMAVLLHYFLLTAFAWMFCEGILLHIVLIKVDMTGAAARHSKKPLYLLGWGKRLLKVIQKSICFITNDLSIHPTN